MSDRQRLRLAFAILLGLAVLALLIVGVYFLGAMWVAGGVPYDNYSPGIGENSVG